MERIELAKKLTQEAGAFLKEAFLQSHTVRRKADGSPVTEADVAAERRIVAAISEAFPNDDFVCEEHTVETKKESVSGITWYIDPLDGTTNFAAGIPIYAVSIAYADRDGIAGAAVTIPPLNSHVWAERGKGAWWNGRKLLCATFSDFRSALHLLSYSDRRDERLMRFWKHEPRFRTLGSAVVSFCLLAGGAAHTYVALHQHPWDFAAGLLFTQEAGAVAVTHDGAPFRFPSGTDMLVSSPEGIAALVEIFRAT